MDVAGDPIDPVDTEEMKLDPETETNEEVKLEETPSTIEGETITGEGGELGIEDEEFVDEEIIPFAPEGE